MRVERVTRLTRVLTENRDIFVLLFIMSVGLAGAVVLIRWDIDASRARASRDMAAAAESAAGYTSRYLAQRLESLVQLSRLPEIRVELETSRALDRATIDAIDVAWERGVPMDTLSVDPLKTSLSQLLAQLTLSRGFARELLVADRQGALVAASARTSDFDQSDESWWTDPMSAESGACLSPFAFPCVHIDGPKLDESAGVLALELSVPVFPLEDGAEPIGVVKAVVEPSEMSAALEVLQLAMPAEVYLLDSPEEGSRTLALIANGRFDVTEEEDRRAKALFEASADETRLIAAARLADVERDWVILLAEPEEGAGRYRSAKVIWFVLLLCAAIAAPVLSGLASSWARRPSSDVSGKTAAESGPPP